MKFSIADNWLLVIWNRKFNKCSKVHVVGWVIAAHDPGLVFLREEASLVDDANTNVDNIIVKDGMLGEVGERRSTEQARNKEFEPL